MQEVSGGRAGAGERKPVTSKREQSHNQLIMNRNTPWKIALLATAIMGGLYYNSPGADGPEGSVAEGKFLPGDCGEAYQSGYGLSHSLVVPDTIPDDQWEVLFDGKMANRVGEIWRGTDSDTFPSDIWAVQDGMLFVQDHKWPGDLITREKFTDFMLVFEFKLTRTANGGIKYFVNRIKNYHLNKMIWNGPEYQIIDEYNNVEIRDDPNGLGSTAALYLLYRPRNKKLNPPGEWNTGKIVVRGNHVEHWLNGVEVLQYERGSRDYREKISKTKFNHYRRYGETRSGHIMLTDHDGDKVFFRSIIIKRLK